MKEGIGAKEHGAVVVFQQTPRPALRPFIKRFLVIEFPASHSDVHLPDTSPVAAFSLRGKCRLDARTWAPPSAFTGLHVTLRAHEHCHGHAVLLVSFTTVGAAPLLRPSLEEFAGTTTDLAGLLGRPQELDRLHEQLAEPQDHARRVELLEDFMLARVRVSEPDPLVGTAVRWLEQRGIGGRISELTQYIGLSQSALERRFRRVVGISPKKFASVLRLQRAVRLRQTGADLTAVAHAAGYFDQSHFITDFRRATGSSPEAFFRRGAAD
jgi:AraC-like DNA-binding protein